ncbi:unnamed protein product [Rhizoctonia solani]|uniref:Zn(2)-C6 fungal-type domain-containing protein n=1 Tax=Rhizoctonia solani TaxID=456999 RepID=A0A8H3CMU9_9AGAM|nr:unnamed protein product [Rhizoctonia solani]
MAPIRSTTGCLACKTKRKKCDETKPHCLRCQKSRTPCPGYTYIQDPNNPTGKPRTLPGPRTVLGRSRTTGFQGTSLMAKTAVPELQQEDQLSLNNCWVNSNISHGVLGGSKIENHATISESIDTSGQYPIDGSVWHPSINLGTSRSLVAENQDLVRALPRVGVAPPLTSGQASLLAALFSLGQAPDLDPPPLRPQPNADLLFDPNALLVTNRSSPDGEKEIDIVIHDNEDTEGVVSVIRHELALDKTAESNALPFVLQGYAAWVNRMAFEPQKLTDIARNLVFSHFEDGEQSRWSITLLANIGNKIGGVELLQGTDNPVLSALQRVVRRRIKTVKALHNPRRTELIKALECVVETMLIHFFISPLSEVITLRQEAAPIFRQLCPEPLGAPINLLSILQHPLSCMRQYVQIDIFSIVIMDMPSLFQYDIALPATQSLALYQSVPANQADGITQWLHGIPNEIILLFARMKAMQRSGLVPNNDTVASLEWDIHKLPPYSGSSSDRFLSIMRSVVQECWRQAAFIYLYMVVCGDLCDTPRVQGALRRYLRLLNGTNPGRLPDEFLIMNLVLVAPAAQRPRDRAVIRQRLLGIYALGKTFRANKSFIGLIEDNWARADSERKQIVQSELAVGSQCAVDKLRN